MFPFDDLFGGLFALPDDVVAVIGLEEYRLGDAVPFVLIFLGEVHQSRDVWQLFAGCAFGIVAETVKHGAGGLLSEEVVLSAVVFYLLGIESEDLLQVLLEGDN